MSMLKVLHQISLFDDTETSNSPDQLRIDYKLSQEEELSKDLRLDLTLPGDDVTDITLLSDTYDWLYVLSDQEIALRLNGLATDQVLIEPSQAGTQDGLFVKRGEVTSLSISVISETDAKVFILAGKN